MRRVILAAVTVVTVVAMSLVTGAGSADAAAAKWSSKSLPYKVSSRVYSKPLKRCINVVLTGKIKFSYRKYSKYGTYQYRNPKLVDPQLKIGVGTKCASGAKPAKLHKLTLKQSWHAKSCHWNPSITAGLEWKAVGGGVSVSPSCSDESYARRKANYGKDSTYEMNTSGNPVVWKHTQGAKATAGPCMEAFVHGVAYSTKSKSDDFLIQGLKVCMKVK